MIKGIMAVDEKGGISKGKSMPWPKNTEDLKWFKKNTLNQVVVMGSGTWADPFMPTPLKLANSIEIKIMKAIAIMGTTTDSRPVAKPVVMTVADPVLP